MLKDKKGTLHPASRPGILVQLFMVLWSALTGLALLVLKGLSFMGKEVFQISERSLTKRGPGSLHLFLKKAKGRQGGTVIFCSSAGEYEQAAPLIRRLVQAGERVVIFFFSTSGLNFARVREEACPCFLAPVDLPCLWRYVYRSLKPARTLVIRHELWPGFLATASKGGRPLYLLNACAGLKGHSPVMHKIAKAFLLQFFTKIYLVSAEDQDFFTRELQVPSPQLAVCGDTKYDQVLERSKLRVGVKDGLCEILARLRMPLPQPVCRMIVGSAWEQDYQLALGALRIIQNQEPEACRSIELLVALHEPTEKALLQLELAVQAAGFRSVRFSGTAADHKTPEQSPPVIVVDSVGFLSELYGSCHLALVGGAMHNRLHNVLEPACYGLGIAFGPLYRNSPEATLLVKQRLAEVVSHPGELVHWWLREIRQRHPSGKAVKKHMLRYMGATDKILSDMNQRHFSYE